MGLKRRLVKERSACARSHFIREFIEPLHQPLSRRKDCLQYQRVRWSKPDLSTWWRVLRQTGLMRAVPTGGAESKGLEGQGGQTVDDAFNVEDFLVDEFADVFLFVDVDLQQKVEFTAGRIQLRDDFALVYGVRNFVGFTGLAAYLHKHTFHGKNLVCIFEIDPSYIEPFSS